MVDNSQEPKEHDISLCGHSKFPADGVVLGELERINQLMAYGRIEQKIDALLDAFEYGQAGLEIIIHSLHDSSREVREAAYFLLQESTELSAKEVLQEYIPYEFFKCLHAWNGETVMSLCFSISSDWKTLVSVDNGKCNLWDLRTGHLIRTLDIDLPNDDVDDVTDYVNIAFISDTQTLLISSEGIVSVCLIRGEKIHTLEGSAPVAFSTDAKVIVSGGADNTIIVWDLQTGEKLCILEGHSSRIVDIAISPDGQTIVSSSDVSSYFANDTTIKVWGV
ncbi:WD40 repeat domain-containing protein [Nostoc sp.]|uniref:WD40 repeat domain-containing protein n=1 Tax=Nostoc sp. TaxID=1180 RepID=UPI002FF6275D